MQTLINNISGETHVCYLYSILLNSSPSQIREFREAGKEAGCCISQHFMQTQIKIVWNCLKIRAACTLWRLERQEKCWENRCGRVEEEEKQEK